MINFTEVEKSVRELKTEFRQGHLDEETFEDHLLEMIDVAGDGHYWMFGHESERWFRYDGERWVPANPDEFLDSPSADSQRLTADGSSGHDMTTNDVEPNWLSVNLGWFLTSLVIIVAIGGIIYYSAIV